MLDDLDARHLVHRGQQVVHEGLGHELPLAVVGEFFIKGGADAVGDAAQGHAAHDVGIDHRAAVVADDVAMEARQPEVAVDLELVEARYNTLAAAFRGADIFYAIKANPAPEILDRVAALGGCFDCASIGEIELVLSRGVSPNRISFGNTIKKERVIHQAFEYGVRLFAFDSMAELEKLERSAPGASLFCRILAENDSADWPLSRKFGCSVAMAGDLLIEADRRGMDAYGVSFHVGSQQKNPRAWAQALGDVGRLMARLDAAGVGLRMINLGGGMPATYDNSAETDLLEYGAVVLAAVREQFGTRPLDLIIEPGRGLVGDAGVIRGVRAGRWRATRSHGDRWQQGCHEIDISCCPGVPPFTSGRV